MKLEAYFDRTIRNWVVITFPLSDYPAEYFANRYSLLASYPHALAAKRNSAGGYCFEVSK